VTGPTPTPSMSTHDLVDVPAFGATRLTCTRCGRAALTLGRFWYGSAATLACGEDRPGAQAYASLMAFANENQANP
jgi:hypothetical protein